MGTLVAEPHDDIKIAIIQTGSWGDNINSTLMLKPLKTKYPKARIEVHTSSYYASAFFNNHYIDKLIQHKTSNKLGSIQLSQNLDNKLVGYDMIFNPHPMYNPDKRCSKRHPEWGTNLIYSWVRALEDKDVDYDLPLETVMFLTGEEMERVDKFVSTVSNFESRTKNLMEIHGESGQTFWNSEWTNAVVQKLCSRGEIVFISHRHGVPELARKFPGLCYNVNTLSIRECAELFNRCDKFFSVSSGLSNACNTNWCRNDIEWIETINNWHDSSAPIRSDNKSFWYDQSLSKFLSAL